jgi:hypothetical protein
VTTSDFRTLFLPRELKALTAAHKSSSVASPKSHSSPRLVAAYPLLRASPHLCDCLDLTCAD